MTTAHALGAHLQDYLGAYLTAEWDLTLGGEDYEMASDADLLALGYPAAEVPGLLVLRHVASGQCFEVPIQVPASPVPTRRALELRRSMAANSLVAIAAWAGPEEAA